MKKKIAIIGAGISGLSLAYYLKKAAVDFTLFEQSSHIGGVIKSHKNKGFIYESGPNTGTLSNIETVELFEDLSKDFQLVLADEAAKKRLILKGNHWHALPSGPISGIKTPLFSLRDKLKLLTEPFIKKGDNPMESIADMVKRRMGESFLDYAIDPFISGIYAGNPNTLVTKYALPKLYQLEQNYGSFIGGAIKKSKEPKSEREKKVSKKIFSAQNGLSDIVNALVTNIGIEHIKLNSTIKVERTPNGEYRIGETNYTHVISTVNAKELSAIFPFLKSTQLTKIENINYAKVAEIAFGFDKWEGMDINAFGGLIPSKENKHILGILFMSSLFKGRAPKNGALITCFVGGTKNKDLVDIGKDELMEIVKPELELLLGIKQFNPSITEVFYHNNAIAQYESSTEDRLLNISTLEKEYPNIFMAGSIRDGVGMADRIKQAKDIAETIIEV